MRLIPSQFVKPYRKSNQNDFLDGEAIAEAVTKQNMRFAQLKTQEQLDWQALHRVRDRLGQRRTALINEIRGFLRERLGELGRAGEYFTKAFELREHASEREKLTITADYYQNVTGELEKAAQTFQEETASYPRDSAAHLDLGTVYAEQGQYEKAVDTYRESCPLAPDDVASCENLANSLARLTAIRRSTADNPTGAGARSG